MSTIPNELHPTEMENVRAGYQVASNLAVFYEGAVWSIFNAMLVANSVVVAGISFVPTNQQSVSGLKVLLPIIGLLLCAAWFLLVRRAHGHYIYFLLSARELEEKYLGGQVKTISRGGMLSIGKSVSLEIGGAQIIRHSSIGPGWMKGEYAMYLVILLFAAVYVAMYFV